MGQISRDHIRSAVQSGLSYILLDFYNEELDADSVTSDNVAGGYHLTTHLIQSGRLAVVQLVRHIRGERTTRENIVVCGKLIRREST